MNWKPVAYSLGRFFWFFALPMLVAWIAIDLLARAGMVDEFEPWYVLAAFALCEMGLLRIKQWLPGWRDPDPDSPYNQRIRKREARKQVRVYQKKLAKARKRLTDEQAQRVRRHIAAVLQALDEPASDWSDALERLETAYAETVAPVSKSPRREYVESLALAVLAALALRVFAIEAFKIPSESMVPSLRVGDHIFVTKFAYGLPLPFVHRYLVHFRTPEPGDVIVFSKPSKKEQGRSDRWGENDLVGVDFIKRVVALPGDTVEVRQSTVFVNGKALPRCHVGDVVFKSKDPITQTWVERTGDMWVERNGDASYTVIEDYLYDDFGPITVPSGQVFVFGDNRDRSSDSRIWGGVPLGNIKGRASLIWWSNERPYGFAWNRVGRVIGKHPHLSASQRRALAKCGISD